VLTSAAQHAYAVLMARRGLFLLLLLAAVALAVGLGAALEAVSASAEPRPGMPRRQCQKFYGPGGAVVDNCWLA
jgi:ABC-type sugar transport system substrate-binding protein